MALPKLPDAIGTLHDPPLAIVLAHHFKREQVIQAAIAASIMHLPPERAITRPLVERNPHRLALTRGLTPVRFLGALIRRRPSDFLAHGSVLSRRLLNSTVIPMGMPTATMVHRMMMPKNFIMARCSPFGVETPPHDSARRARQQHPPQLR